MLAQQDFKAHELYKRPGQHGLLCKITCLRLQGKHFAGTGVAEGINRSSKPTVLCSSTF